MIKAFIDMYDKGWAKDWSLVLVGRKHADEESSSYIQSLEEIAKGYPVELRYNTSIEDLQSLLDKAKIYWHATGYEEAVDKNPDKFEHFGLSTIEAAQYGAVPVVFNGGGQPEIINHGSNGYLWDTTDELVDFTKLLMEDNVLWKKLSNTTINSMKIFGVATQFRWFMLFLSPYFEFEQ
jgi:glycosyltransferase involved in cell wall biosynthesis